MPQYSQKVTFTRTFQITAKNAAEADNKLSSLIDDIEFSSDVQHDGFYPFEDEPVTCPECEGEGEDEHGNTCVKCEGEGNIPFDKA
jgi:RecJ-like exonuclease